MTKPFIVFSDGSDKEIFDSISKNTALEVYPKPKLTQDELKTLLPKITGLVIRSATKVNKELIDAAPNLKYVVRAGEGTDNIDKAYCAEKGIKVSNTPGANNNSAAEHAVALMLTVLRKTAQADASMRQGKWDKDAFTGNELSNKTVGIMGFGRIGQIVAKRISGFEPKILFFDPLVHESQVKYATKVNTLDELFSKSDIVTVHTPLIDATKGVVNHALLSKMKPTAILVNAARGKIVNENDLYEILKAKKIKGAGLDVFANEPLEEGSKLKELDNIVLTPHLGGSTEEAQFRVGEMAAHQIVEFFTNKNLLNEVKA
ncbi:MAG TPA: hydroxyacid dehydrogenase [Bacteriovoracaceae bacterium]|nr:hydroxyacid dehydrogenase [Bacteriovoracaceae bacterium]